MTTKGQVHFPSQVPRPVMSMKKDGPGPIGAKEGRGSQFSLEYMHPYVHVLEAKGREGKGRR